MKKSEMEARVVKLWNDGYSEELKYYGRKSTKAFCDGCIISAVILYAIGSMVDACILNRRS